MRQIVVYNATEWQGMYVDGLLNDENHYIELSSIEQAAQNQPCKISFRDASKTLEAYIMDNSGFPDTLEICEKM